MYTIPLQTRYPIEGRRIKITWLPSCRNVPNGVPNPYIGMEGIVENLKHDGTFDLVDTGVLILLDNKYEYIYLD